MHSVIPRTITKIIKRRGITKKPIDKLWWNSKLYLNNPQESRNGRKENSKKRERNQQTIKK